MFHWTSFFCGPSNTGKETLLTLSFDFVFSFPLIRYPLLNLIYHQSMGLILGALFLQPSFLVRVENRYSASRGAHLNLKRTEKARVLVSKIPVMVDTLVAKTRAWEEEHNMSFAYDGVPLLAMLDDYGMLRQEREDEKRRLREQKKVQEQPHAEQDTVFSTRPSPARPVSAKKPVGHELATEEPMEHQTGVCL
ncbi:hypothetical protein YC2023_013623 [Brassica napus]